ncbi:GFA family protein [Dyella acidiphila]|uniref:GFA family protein n=1 Tax=Dyella acidiphila TaxID=2775866 RepID=A0ABR9G697_9GAMM|nr:GFA family protein [Dyella acidiphila]MBE1159534.1 GFA family protein [Dyella acidiphila]
MSNRTASCYCGQLSIEVQGDTLGVGICHCLACQQRTGSVFAALAAYAVPFTVRGNATEFVRIGDHGAHYRFRFCPVCGSNVFHTEEGNDQYVIVAVGAFADPAFPAPQDSVYECRRHAWVQVPEAAMRYPQDPP